MAVPTSKGRVAPLGLAQVPLSPKSTFSPVGSPLPAVPGTHEETAGSALMTIFLIRTHASGPTTSTTHRRWTPELVRRIFQA